MSISVVINTINEAKSLPTVLKSVRDFASEIIVVDMESDDDSQVIAQKYGAKVYTHKRLAYVEPARNFGIKKASSDWVLVLDPDEEVPNSLAKKLIEIASENIYTHVKIPRKNIIFGKWIKNARWWPDYNIRFFRKGYVTWSSTIHSIPGTEGQGIELDSTIEDYALIHHHYESIEQFIDRMNRYTTVQSKNLVESGYKFHWHDIVKRPTDEFFSRFFLGEAYLDGIHGLALSTLQAFSELVLYLKVWQIEKYNPSEIRLMDIHSVLKKSDNDLHYWLADYVYKLQGGILNKVKRKFKLS